MTNLFNALSDPRLFVTPIDPDHVASVTSLCPLMSICRSVRRRRRSVDLSVRKLHLHYMLLSGHLFYIYRPSGRLCLNTRNIQSLSSGNALTIDKAFSIVLMI